ncbi:MAG: transposase [Tepidisphaeraceae bacterium]|jgi:transposase
MENTTQITDGITTGVEARKQRGLQIAALARIDKKDDVYIVPSQTDPRHPKYEVHYHDKHPTCTCPDFETRGCRCKHIYAVEYVIQREEHPDGSTTVTQSVTVTQTRKTYPQDWPNYNAAQVNEKRHFQALLGDLCQGIETPAVERPNGGRPQFPLADAVFSVVYKIYSTHSARRFVGDLGEAKDKGYITQLPHYNTIFKFIEKPELYPILLDLIERAALPLKDVESQFAVDSTGFAFCRFTRWFDIKYNRFTAEQQWIKAHICAGTKTNVVTAVEIHRRDEADQTQLPALVKSTAKNFDMAEVSADKAYSDRNCHKAIAKVGAIPYIMFKANTTGGVGGLFRKAFHYFQFKKDEFLAHYHRRSNVESTVMMIKTKFGDAVRSKTEVAARNEVLCKLLCHNICCLISAMYELGIEPMLAGAVAHKLDGMPTNPKLFNG